MFLTLTYGVVGARVMTRDRRNRVGWVLWLQPSLLALSAAGIGYAQMSMDRFQGSMPATALLAWAGGWALVLFIVLTAIVIPLSVPDRATQHAPLAPCRGSRDDEHRAHDGGSWFRDSPVLPGIPNPIGVAGADQALALASGLGGVGIVLSLPLVMASVVIRFRRGTAVEREQVKWFALGMLVPALFLVAALVAQDVEWLWVLLVTSLGLIPVTIGIAILRYRLYEIDRLISRTIGWAIVTALLVAMLAAGVVLLEAILAPITTENTSRSQDRRSSRLALFQPVRRRVQGAVDRRFDRARYDGQRTVDAFAEDLRNETDINAVLHKLSETTRAAVAPMALDVWIRPSSSPR